jgi:acyl carrier protein
MELQFKLQKLFDKEISIMEFMRYPTVNSFVQSVRSETMIKEKL